MVMEYLDRASDSPESEPEIETLCPSCLLIHTQLPLGTCRPSDIHDDMYWRVYQHRWMIKAMMLLDKIEENTRWS
jgi:hypothetical protein